MTSWPKTLSSLHSYGSGNWSRNWQRIKADEITQDISGHKIVLFSIDHKTMSVDVAIRKRLEAKPKCRKMELRDWKKPYSDDTI